jgi:hypothetical protein
MGGGLSACLPACLPGLDLLLFANVSAVWVFFAVLEFHLCSQGAK